jgi:hypothetical protein
MIRQIAAAALFLLALSGPAKADEDQEEGASMRIGQIQEYQDHVVCSTTGVFELNDFVYALKQGKSPKDALAVAGPRCELKKSITLVVVRPTGPTQNYQRGGILKALDVFYALGMDGQKWLLVHPTSPKQKV